MFLLGVPGGLQLIVISVVPIGLIALFGYFMYKMGYKSGQNDVYKDINSKDK